MIVVAGEALIDLAPGEEGGEVVYRAHPGGGPFNTAVGLGRLGVPTAFLGRLSDDGFGSLLTQRLAAAAVDLRFIRSGPEPTTLAVVSFGPGGGENVFRFYVEGTAAVLLSEADLPPVDESVAALHVGTLGLALEPMATTLEVLVTRHAARRLVALDPNVRPDLVTDRGSYVGRLERLAAVADVVKLSQADADWLTGGGPAEDLLSRWRGMGAGLIVVTRGADGAIGWPVSGPAIEVSTPQVELADTVGAGDAFNAGLLAWLYDHHRLTKAAARSLGGDDLADALGFAADVAARTCARPGADPPWRHELRHSRR